MTNNNKKSNTKDKILLAVKTINLIRANKEDVDAVSDAEEDIVGMKKDILFLLDVYDKENGTCTVHDFIINNFDAFLRSFLTKRELASVKVEDVTDKYMLVGSCKDDDDENDLIKISELLKRNANND